MADKRTILSVPASAGGHAKRFGAQLDKATGSWFMIGPIAAELLNYVSRPKSKPFKERAPNCPLCGGTTRKIQNRKGDAYWSCANYFQTGCPGKVDYLDYLDEVAPTTSVSDYLPKVAGQSSGPREKPIRGATDKTAKLLAVKRVEVYREAITILGGEAQAVAWLNQGKFAFLNRTPIQMLATAKGCNAVLKLLREVWK